MSDPTAKKQRTLLAGWLRRNARAVNAALARSPDLDDRNLARELDRLMTQLVGEGWDVRERHP